MPYESEVTVLAQGALAAHGSLEEVVFLRTNDFSLLVFSDGFVLPTWFTEEGDDDWKAMNDEATKYSYQAEVARSLGGTHPMSLLTFGYSGTGPTCFARFLQTAGFSSTSVEDVRPPLKLRKDGSRVSGTVKDEMVEWEDGSETPRPGHGKRTKKRWFGR